MFILSYDREQISRQLRKSGTSPDFLDKVVQSPEDLPAAEQDEIDRFLIFSDLVGHKSHLDELLDELKISGDRRTEFDKKSAEFYVSNLRSFFPTLRNAKRFLIGLSVRLPVVKDEVNLLDFFLLELLRVLANPIYQDIWNNSYYYLPAWTRKLIMSSPFGFEVEGDKEKIREKIRRHIDTLLQSDARKDNIVAVLKSLFPARIEDALGRPTNYGDNATASLRANKRLTHPECFDKYFVLAVPKGTIPDSVVEANLASWLKAAEPEIAILKSLGTLKEQHQLAETLNRIVVFLEKIDEKLVMPLLRAVTLSVESVPLKEDRSDQDAQFKLILFLLDERVPDHEKQSAVEAVLRDIPPIEVAVRINNTLMDSQSMVTWGLRRSVDIPTVKRTVRDRFQEEFVATGRDIFEVNGHPLYVLYQIGAHDSDSTGLINGYAMELLERKPEHIGKLINSFLTGTPEASQFQFDQLKLVYDAKRLADLARRAGERAWGNQAEKLAIEKFLGQADRPDDRSQ
jgi:hypothetical protein